ncbi:hypothetical protein RhiirC2_797350 [Rhizophagus irregularis]|uniref:Uncharacterized protein n=1 Tax=Rhizophagus irregularis TaxID=588596 RepID=A0A2N1M861_9GLOM|nr:hypothetical protein RhiirC2_797350 [Rhizophagus irregularis]
MEPFDICIDEYLKSLEIINLEQCKRIGGHSIVIQNLTLSENFRSIRDGNFIHNILKRNNKKDQEKNDQAKRVSHIKRIKIDDFFSSNSKRSGFLRNWKKGNEQDTLLPRETQASNDLPINIVQWKSEFEEDAFLQEAVRENESDNVKTYAKNILKSVNTCDKLRKALKSKHSKLRTSSNISNI